MAHGSHPRISAAFGGALRLLKVDLGKLLGLWIEQFRRDPTMPRLIADMLVDRLATTNEAELLMWVRGETSNADPYFAADILKGVCREIGAGVRVR